MNDTNGGVVEMNGKVRGEEWTSFRDERGDKRRSYRDEREKLMNMKMDCTVEKMEIDRRNENMKMDGTACDESRDDECTNVGRRTSPCNNARRGIN